MEINDKEWAIIKRLVNQYIPMGYDRHDAETRDLLVKLTGLQWYYLTDEFEMRQRERGSGEKHEQR